MENDFLEKTLESIIFENKDNIWEKGFPILYKNTERQYQIDSRRIDLFSYEEIDDVFYFKIFELKRGVIDNKALLQISDYYFRILMKNKGVYKDYKYDLYLIGNNYDNDVLSTCLLSEFLHFYTYKYDYSGIKFEKMSKTHSEFKEIVTNGIK